MWSYHHHRKFWTRHIPTLINSLTQCSNAICIHGLCSWRCFKGCNRNCSWTLIELSVCIATHPIANGSSMSVTVDMRDYFASQSSAGIANIGTNHLHIDSGLFNMRIVRKSILINILMQEVKTQFTVHLLLELGHYVTHTLRSSCRTLLLLGELWDSMRLLHNSYMIPTEFGGFPGSWILFRFIEDLSRIWKGLISRTGRVPLGSLYIGLIVFH